MFSLLEYLKDPVRCCNQLKDLVSNNDPRWETEWCRIMSEFLPLAKARLDILDPWFNFTQELFNNPSLCLQVKAYGCWQQFIRRYRTLNLPSTTIYDVLLVPLLHNYENQRHSRRGRSDEIALQHSKLKTWNAFLETDIVEDENVCTTIIKPLLGFIDEASCSAYCLHTASQIFCNLIKRVLLTKEIRSIVFSRFLAFINRAKDLKKHVTIMLRIGKQFADDTAAKGWNDNYCRFLKILLHKLKGRSQFDVLVEYFLNKKQVAAIFVDTNFKILLSCYSRELKHKIRVLVKILKTSSETIERFKDMLIFLKSVDSRCTSQMKDVWCTVIQCFNCWLNEIDQANVDVEKSLETGCMIMLFPLSYMSKEFKHKSFVNIWAMEYKATLKIFGKLGASFNRSFSSLVMWLLEHSADTPVLIAVVSALEAVICIVVKDVECDVYELLSLIKRTSLSLKFNEADEYEFLSKYYIMAKAYEKYSTELNSCENIDNIGNSEDRTVSETNSSNKDDISDVINGADGDIEFQQEYVVIHGATENGSTTVPLTCGDTMHFNKNNSNTNEKPIQYNNLIEAYSDVSSDTNDEVNSDIIDNEAAVSVTNKNRSVYQATEDEKTRMKEVMYHDAPKNADTVSDTSALDSAVSTMACLSCSTDKTLIENSVLPNCDSSNLLCSNIDEPSTNARKIFGSVADDNVNAEVDYSVNYSNITYDMNLFNSSLNTNIRKEVCNITTKTNHFGIKTVNDCSDSVNEPSSNLHREVPNANTKDVEIVNKTDSGVSIMHAKDILCVDNEQHGNERTNYTICNFGAADDGSSISDIVSTSEIDSNITSDTAEYQEAHHIGDDNAAKTDVMQFLDEIEKDIWSGECIHQIICDSDIGQDYYNMCGDYDMHSHSLNKLPNANDPINKNDKPFVCSDEFEPSGYHSCDGSSTDRCTDVLSNNATYGQIVTECIEGTVHSSAVDMGDCDVIYISPDDCEKYTDQQSEKITGSNNTRIISNSDRSDDSSNTGSIANTAEERRKKIFEEGMHLWELEKERGRIPTLTPRKRAVSESGCDYSRASSSQNCEPLRLTLCHTGSGNYSVARRTIFVDENLPCQFSERYGVFYNQYRKIAPKPAGNKERLEEKNYENTEFPKKSATRSKKSMMPDNAKRKRERLPIFSNTKRPATITKTQVSCRNMVDVIDDESVIIYPPMPCGLNLPDLEHIPVGDEGKKYVIQSPNLPTPAATSVDVLRKGSPSKGPQKHFSERQSNSERSAKIRKAIAQAILESCTHDINTSENSNEIDAIFEKFTQKYMDTCEKYNIPTDLRTVCRLYKKC